MSSASGQGLVPEPEAKRAAADGDFDEVVEYLTPIEHSSDTGATDEYPLP